MITRSFLATSRRLALLLLILMMALSHATTPMQGRAQEKPAEKSLIESRYGTQEFSESALIGILYDLKQDQKHTKLQIDQKKYNAITNEFLSSNWDESVLNRYYRVTRPMYTTQVFIPLSSAGDAPKAFKVENVVKPSFWMIHYKGQVAPPTSGRWRFWGYGSEICSVAVNGKTVLVSNWLEETPMPMPDVKWTSPAPPGPLMHRAHLIGGNWMELKAGEVVDLDVLIGERAGGNFAAVLLIEKEGDKYEMKDGRPVFPIFQLAPFNTPSAAPGQPCPNFSRNGPIWKGIQ